MSKFESCDLEAPECCCLWDLSLPKRIMHAHSHCPTHGLAVRAALEEAAKVAENWSAEIIAAQIRALKDPRLPVAHPKRGELAALVHGGAPVMTNEKREVQHYHFCPGCSRTVICPTPKGCTRLSTGGRCVDCGGTWKRPLPEKKRS